MTMALRSGESRGSPGGQTPLFFDSQGWCEFPKPSDQPPVSVDQFGGGASVGNMYQLCTDRHEGGINVVFADDHAENVPLGNLWTLEWYPDFNPKKVWGGFPQPSDYQ